MMPVCVIVRHGNTFGPGDPPRRIGARTDLPLVDSGREQALKLGSYFRDNACRFDRVLIAPLERTHETARLILSAMDERLPLVACDWLAEIDHGPDEGQLQTTVVSRIGEAALTDWDKHGVSPPGWLVDADRRIAAWQTFYASDPAGTTLIVSSNGAARFALFADDRLARQARSLPSLKLATGAFGMIALEPQGPRLTAWNQRP
jgi:broad specificity phosphatase PhoE